MIQVYFNTYFKTSFRCKVFFKKSYGSNLMAHFLWLKSGNCGSEVQLLSGIAKSFEMLLQFLSIITHIFDFQVPFSG